MVVPSSAVTVIGSLGHGTAKSLLAVPLCTAPLLTLMVAPLSAAVGVKVTVVALVVKVYAVVSLSKDGDRVPPPETVKLLNAALDDRQG